MKPVLSFFIYYLDVVFFVGAQRLRDLPSYFSRDDGVGLCKLLYGRRVKKSKEMRLCADLRNECLVILHRYNGCYLHVPSLKGDLLEHFTLLHGMIKETRAVIKNEQ